MSTENICPACGHENLPGADVCSNCSTDLAQFDAVEHAITDDKFEIAILHDKASQLSLNEARIIPSSTSVQEAINILHSEHIGALLITDTNNQISGIFTAMDVLRRVTNVNPLPLDQPIGDYMTLNPQNLSPESRIVDALHKINIGGFGNLPIISNDQKTTLLGVKDILDYMIQKNPKLAEMQSKGSK